MADSGYRHPLIVSGLAAVLLTAMAGCASSPLTPVRFATTRGSAEPMFILDSLMGIFEAAPFREVQRGVSNSIGYPTQFIVLKPMQIHAHLASGYIPFAFVDEGDEEEVLADGAGEVIASPIFVEGPPTCTALFVVPKDSAIESLSDLKGKRVAFGPPNHPALHWAALHAIVAAGVEYNDLAKQLLPIPGSLQFHLNSLEAAKAALLKIEADVGVVDEADFLKWPESGGNILTNALSLAISQDQLKIIGRTEPVPIFPSGAVLASSKADPELVEKVRHYLTQVLPRKQHITKALGLVSYKTPEQEVQSASR